MEREQFTFYKSFATAVKRIRKSSDRAAAYDAIVDYALYGIEPDLDKLPDAACIVFTIAKPILDSSRRKAESGRRGGRAEQTRSKGKTEANDKQEEPESKPEANGKQEEIESKNKDKDKDKNKDKIKDKCPLSPITPQRRNEMIGQGLDGRSGQLVIAVGDWVQYKIERREPYQETGLRNLISQIRKAAEQHGDDAVVAVIRRSMSANYQGIVFDWLDKLKWPAPKVTTAAEYKPPAPKSAEEIYGIVDRI